MIPTQVDDGPNKLFLANIPTCMDEYTLIEALKFSQFGDLKSFHLVKDNKTNDSKGFGFFELNDESQIENCVNSLNGSNFYGRTLTCKRALIQPKVKSSDSEPGSVKMSSDVPE